MQQLETERLLLRAFSMDDIGDVHAYMSDPEVVQFEPDRPMSWQETEKDMAWRLAERLGLVREAHLKQNIYFWTDDTGSPIWKDTYVYAKINPHNGSN